MDIYILTKVNGKHVGTFTTLTMALDWAESLCKNLYIQYIDNGAILTDSDNEVLFTIKRELT